MSLQHPIIIKALNVISQIRFPLLAVLFSLAIHLCALSTISGWGSYQFTLPPDAREFITADFTQLPPQVKPAPPLGKSVLKEMPSEEPNPPKQKQPETEKTSETVKSEQELSEDKVDETITHQLALAELPKKQLLRSQPAEVKLHQLPPIRKVEQFIRSKREKLFYRISLFGMPVGSSVLEASSEKGELKISCRTESTGALALFYPVDTTIQTRMFNGRYIMTTTKQRQGDLVNDIGFTISLEELNVFWADRSNKRYTNNPIPNDEVLDILSALYFLRNGPLKTGETTILHLFDSNRYIATPVKVLRSEKINLPGLYGAQALVVKPELTTESFFRRTGEILIWLTDDEFHVPVRMEAEIALGRITAELVGAETEN